MRVCVRGGWGVGDAKLTLICHTTTPLDEANDDGCSWPRQLTSSPSATSVCSEASAAHELPVNSQARFCAREHADR